MSNPIAPLGRPAMAPLERPKIAPLAADKSEPSSAAAKANKLSHVAEEFESMMLRQLLSHVDLGMKGGGAGYGATASEALATGLSKAGGLGLHRQIEQMLGGAQLREEMLRTVKKMEP